MADWQATDVALSMDLESPEAVLYFLWDGPITNRELRARLTSAFHTERTCLLAKILREARDPDAWQDTTPQEVDQRCRELVIHLGRRLPFWEFLLAEWRRQGQLASEPPQ